MREECAYTMALKDTEVGELERNLFFAQVRETLPFYASNSQICPLLQNETALSVSLQAVYHINIFENIWGE